jgi:hypothetical protein
MDAAAFLLEGESFLMPCRQGHHGLGSFLLPSSCRVHNHWCEPSTLLILVAKSMFTLGIQRLQAQSEQHV